jgi:hypothetical protein
MKRALYQASLPEKGLKIVESILFQLEDMEEQGKRGVIENIAERGKGTIKAMELFKHLQRLDDIEYDAAAMITDPKKEYNALNILRQTAEVLKNHFHAKIDVVYPYTVFNYRVYPLEV